MEERHGARGTVAEGIFFTEGSVEGELKGHLKASIHGQNANLGKVKRALAQQAQRKGATVVANFRYGQKRAFFAWDDMRWFGEGDGIAPHGSSATPGAFGRAEAASK
jgi:hypothetical protein